MKRHKMKRLLGAVLSLAISASMIPAQYVSAATSSDYVYYDFGDTSFAQTVITGATVSTGLETETNKYSETGLILRERNKNNAPQIKLGLKVDTDTYKYVKTAVGYAQAKSDTDMETWIAFDGAEKTKLASIDSKGNSLTAVDGGSYVKADFQLSGSKRNFITLTAQMNTGGVSGEKNIVYCPAESDNNVSAYAFVKYMAFFKTKDDADKFDPTVTGATYTVNETKHNAVIDPINHTAVVSLPAGDVTSETFSFSDIDVKLYTDKCTATQTGANNTEMYADYDVVGVDGKTVSWRVSVDCRQIDDTYVNEMVTAFNGMTSANADTVWSTYEHALSSRIDGYASFNATYKPQLIAGLTARVGTLTSANYADIIKEEMLYARIKNECADGAAFKTFAETEGINGDKYYVTFFGDLEDDERNSIFSAAIAENCYSDFTNNLWEASVLKALSNAQSYGAVKKIVEANLGIIGFTEAEYNSLMASKEHSDEAFRDLVGENYATAAAVKSAVISAVNNLKEREIKDPESTKDNGSKPSEIVADNPTDITVIFKDLDNVAWAQNDIKALYEKKIVSGRGNNMFAPSDNVTREEFVTIAVNAFGYKDTTANGVFTDVVPSAWYENAVNAAYNAKIVSGISEDKFGVGVNITREDIAAIAYRILTNSGAEFDDAEEAGFDDGAEIAEYAAKAVAVLSANGVINGSDGKFMPKKNATRAETAVIIRRLMSLTDGTDMEIKDDDNEEEATEQMKALNALGIYSDDMLTKRREFVTRRAFAEIAANFADVGNYGGVTAYSDLTEDEAGYAKAAVENGLMDDGDNGKFNADVKIVREDVIRLLMKTIMNTTDIAEFGGYLSAAKALQIEIDFAEGETITYAMLANMIMESAQNATPIKTGSYTQSGDNYLERKHKAKVMKGTVTATDKTGLYGEKTISGYVRIGTIDYATKVDLNDKIGMTVKFIEQNIDGEDTVIFVYESYENYIEKTFEAKDIYSCDGKKYRVNVNNKYVDYELSANVVVMYNGAATSDYTNATFKPTLGTVRIVDSDGNGEYDVVFINEYTTILVGSIDTKNEAVYDKNGNGSVSWKNADSVEVYKNGNATTVSGIKIGDVLQAYASDGGKYIKYVISDASVSGKLDKVDEDEKVIIIDGTEYPYDVDYVNKYSGTLVIGDETTALVNADGVIVKLSFQTETMSIAFLIDASVADDDDGREAVILKMFTADDARVRKMYTTGEKIGIDGTKKTPADILEILQKGGTEVLCQPIMYKTDENEKITYIDTAYNNTPKAVDSTALTKRTPDGNETEDSFRMIYAKEFDTDRPSMWAKPCGGVYKSFGRNRLALLANNSATTFIVPTDPKTASSDYFLLSTPAYFGDTTFDNKLEGYSLSSSNIADILVYYDETDPNYQGKLTSANCVRAIADIKEVLNEDNETVVTLTTYGLGYTSNTVTIPDEKNYKEVKTLSGLDTNTYKLGKGDIIWYDLNAKNEITNIRIVFGASETDPVKAWKAGTSNIGSRKYNSVLELKLWFMDVYEIDSAGIATCTTNDLVNFTGDPDTLTDVSYEPTAHFGQQFVVHIDLTEKTPVITYNDAASNPRTTWKDIKDFKTYGNDFSRIIPITKWGYAEGMFIIDMPKNE